MAWLRLNIRQKKEVVSEIGFLKGSTTAGADGLSPSFNALAVLTLELTKPLESQLARCQTPKDRYGSVIVPLYKNGDRSSCENHRN